MLCATMLIATPKIIIANSDISIPLNGSTERLALRPKTAARPMPQDAHPGSSMPVRMPIDETIPALCGCVTNNVLARYTNNASNVPVRILTNNRL